MNLILLILGILIAGGLLYWFPIRAWYRRSDARRLDARRAMSGDGEILSPTWESTLAINIDAPPASIWPLLVAMGYRRGGEYSYDSLDRLFGYLDAPGADRIYPQFQTFAGGDVIPVGRGAGFTARAIEPYRTLVLGGEQEHLRWSWQFELSPLAKGRTRLISRSRARVRPNLRSTVRTPLARLAAFVMTRKMLLDIKHRAEAAAGRGVEAQRAA